MNWSAYPAMRLCVLLLLGLAMAYLGSFLYVFTYHSYIQLLWLCFLIGVVLFEYKRMPAKHLQKTLFLKNMLYCSVVVCFGFMVSLNQIEDDRNDHKIRSSWAPYAWEELNVSATLIKSLDRKGSYLVHISEAQYQDRIVDIESNALMYLSDQEMQSTGFYPDENDPFFAVVQILPINDQQNGFDEHAWLKSLDASLKIKVSCLYKHEPVKDSIIQKLRNYFRANLSATFVDSPQLFALAKAMVLAEKSDLDKEQKDLFSKTGLSHILAVSGLHVGMLLLPLWWIMPHFWTTEFRKWVYLTFATVLIVTYVLLTAFPASVQRASIMAWLLLVGRLWHRNGPPMNILATAAIVMWLIDPATIFEVGFHLSFFAVSSIFLVVKPINECIQPSFKRRLWYRFIIGPFLFTTLLQLAMMPLTVQYFGYFSLIGPIANFIFLPFLSVLLFPVFLISTFFHPFLPRLIEQHLVLLLDLIFSFETALLKNLLQWPSAVMDISSVDWWVWVLLILVIALLNNLKKREQRWKMVIAILLLIISVEGFDLLSWLWQAMTV